MKHCQTLPAFWGNFSRRFFVVLIASALSLGLNSCGGASSNAANNTDDADDTDDETGFQVTGSLSTASPSSSLFRFAQSGDGATDIMLVSPSARGVTCKSVEIGSDGSFDFRLAEGKPWFFYFYDRFQSGFGQFMGRWKSGTLDTLNPTSATGTLELGTITIDDATQIATSSVGTDAVQDGLELDAETAETIGDLDDIATRYSNPDMDNDGTADCGQSNRTFMLDFHVRFDVLINGVQATVTDMIDEFFSANETTIRYSDTGAMIAYPDAFSSSSTGTVKFEDSPVITSEGGNVPADTETSAVSSNDFEGYKGFGANMTSASELPSGSIVFTVNTTEVTFSEVQVPTLAELNAPTGRIFPFVKFNKTDAACVSSCTLSGISYQWMKKTADGWTEATTAELSLLVVDEGGYLSIRVDNDSSKTVGIAIPKTAVSGTVDWDAANTNLSGVTSSEFEAVVTTQLCHIGLSYDDQLGMRYFQNINNAAGTCSS